MTATIRPPDPVDLAPLMSFFGALSIRSRVLRFFAPVRPSAAMVRLACGFAPRAGGGSGSGCTDALIAMHDGVIIGHAMAADRPSDRPAEAPADRPARVLGDRPTEAPAPLRGPVTEIGVVVADAWQGHGVGAALVRALIGRAQARGVTSLSMDVLPDNQQVLAMIARHWTAARTRRAADCVTIQTPLAPDQRAHPAPAGATRRDHQRELAYHGKPGSWRRTA